MKLQRIGGYAVFASIIAFIACGTLSSRVQIESLTMAALSSARNELNLSALLFLISMVLFLVTFVALHERMRADAPWLTRLMLIAVSAATSMAIVGSAVYFGYFETISLQDVSAFRACIAVFQGLYIVLNRAFGLAFLFMGCAVLKTRAFSRLAGGINLLAGIVWIPNHFVAQFGFSFLGPILYALSGIGIIWIAIEMIRQKQFQPESKIMAASK
jgi:uncharacterized membrane protein